MFKAFGLCVQLRCSWVKDMWLSIRKLFFDTCVLPLGINCEGWDTVDVDKKQYLRSMHMIYECSFCLFRCVRTQRLNLMKKTYLVSQPRKIMVKQAFHTFSSAGRTPRSSSLAYISLNKSPISVSSRILIGKFQLTSSL